MDIHSLHKQGVSQRKIAKKLAISRNTVKNTIQSNEFPKYVRAKHKPRKLEPYYDYLRDRLLNAMPDIIPATVLFTEVKAKGYTGGIAQLRRYVAQFKQVKHQDPLIRFETEPGEQLQIDFTTIWGGKNPLKAFVAVLGYSRMAYVQFTDNETTQTWHRCLVDAFHYFGGVPKEALCDNAKALIISRDHYEKGKHKLNDQFLQLAKDHGFTPRFCRPYRAKTKGKVERFNHYLKNSFVTPLKTSLRQQGLALDVSLANAKVGYWLNDTANCREHHTTQRRPIDLLTLEQAHFLPLPQKVMLEDEMLGVGDHMPIQCQLLQHPLSYYDQILEVDYAVAQ